MFNKKCLIIILLLIISISCLSVASATDLNTTTQDQIIIKNNITSNKEIHVNNYEELKNAIEDNNDITIYLNNGDYSITDSMRISDKTITINGNGQTIDGENDYFFMVMDSCTIHLNNLNIINCKVNKHSASKTVVYGAAIEMDDSNLYINNCEFKNNMIDTDEEGYGAAISNNRGYLYITNSYFENNHIKTDTATVGNYARGGAIYTNEYCEISNTLFYNNRVNAEEFGYGGAIYNSDKLILNSCNFTENKAETHTGSIRFNNGFGGALSNYGSVEINFCFFNANSVNKNINNAEKSYGGAIYNEGTIKINSSDFKNNLLETETDVQSGYGYGGAISNNNNGEIDIYHSTFCFNKAHSEDYNRGGAIYNEGKMNIYNSSFIGNSVKGDNGYGGAIYNQGEINIFSSLIQNNTIKTNNYWGAISTGGGIYTSNQIKIYNSQILNNTIESKGECKALGAGITNYGDTIIENCTINNNKAYSESNTDKKSRGGGIYNGYDGKIYIYGKCYLINNHANDYGGAIYNDEEGYNKIIFNCKLLEIISNTAKNGKSIYSKSKYPVIINNVTYDTTDDDIIIKATFNVTSYDEIIPIIKDYEECTINLLPGNYTVTEPLFINNNRNITINGNRMAINCNDKQFMYVDNGANVNLNNLYLINYKNTNSSIYNMGNLSITISLFENNSAIVNNYGNLYLERNILIENQKIINNGNILSKTKIVSLNDDYVKLGDKVLLKFNIFDDNGNLIYDERAIIFYINGTQIKGSLNDPAYYTPKKEGNYSIIINYPYSDVSKQEKVSGSIIALDYSYSGLQSIINSNKVVDLHFDYIFNSTKDKAYQNGLIIDKSVIINGNGYSINGSNLASFFQITKKGNLTLNNIKLINGVNTVISNNGTLFLNNITAKGTVNNNGNINSEVILDVKNKIVYSGDSFYATLTTKDGLNIKTALFKITDDKNNVYESVLYTNDSYLFFAIGIKEGDYKLNNTVIKGINNLDANVRIKVQNGTSFEELRRQIQNTPKDGILCLNHSYYSDGKGLTINKNITIDGNNHALYGASKGIFIVLGGYTLTLVNIALINGFDTVNNSGKIKMNNILFYKNNNAILNYNNITINNSYFISNKGIESSIINNNNYTMISNSIFYNNFANSKGIIINNKDAIIKNCTMLNSVTNSICSIVNNGNISLEKNYLTNVNIVNNGFIKSAIIIKVNNHVIKVNSTVFLKADLFDDNNNSIVDKRNVTFDVNGTLVKGPLGDKSLNYTPTKKGIYTVKLNYAYSDVNKQIANIGNILAYNNNFADLQIAINYLNEVTLLLDYVFNATTDSDYIRGIIINKTVVIDGNGHTIDGSNGVINIFNIKENGTLILKNIKLINALRYCIINNGVLNLNNVTSKAPILNNGVITSDTKFLVVSSSLTTHDSFIASLKTKDGISIIMNNLIFNDDQGHDYKSYIYYNGNYINYVPTGITGHVTFNNSTITGLTNLTSKGDLNITKYSTSKNIIIPSIKKVVNKVTNLVKIPIIKSIKENIINTLKVNILNYFSKMG